jgi:hypothetical protein
MATKQANVAYRMGFEAACRRYKVAAGAMGVNGLKTPMSGMSGTATHQMNNASIPMAMPAANTPMSAVGNALTSPKPFAPIPQTPGVKPAG